MTKAIALGLLGVVTAVSAVASEYSPFVGEDFPMQEKVQEVLGSRALPEIVFGRNEVAAIHFHRALEDLLAHDPEGDG